MYVYEYWIFTSREEAFGHPAPKLAHTSAIFMVVWYAVRPEDATAGFISSCYQTGATRKQVWGFERRAIRHETCNICFCIYHQYIYCLRRLGLALRSIPSLKPRMSSNSWKALRNMLYTSFAADSVVSDDQFMSCDCWSSKPPSGPRTCTRARHTKIARHSERIVHPIDLQMHASCMCTIVTRPHTWCAGA